VDRVVQRLDPLTHQLPALAGEDHVRGGAHRQDGGRADPAGLQRGERRLPVLPQLLEGSPSGVQVHSWVRTKFDDHANHWMGPGRRVALVAPDK
jgi:hypothetical protein